MQREEPDFRQVQAAAGRLGRELGERESKGLAAYLGLLVRWNARMNLVGHAHWGEVLEDLVADSWHLADFVAGLPLPDSPLTLDLGAGAGLPGIPLRIFWTAGEYWLVEPRRKRAAFLSQAVGTLGLKDTRVACRRVEELPQDLRRADLVLGRAFLPWRELVGLARELVRPRGMVLVMGSGDPPDEEAPGLVRGKSAVYECAGKRRYLSVFMPASISS